MFAGETIISPWTLIILFVGLSFLLAFLVGNDNKVFRRVMVLWGIIVLSLSFLAFGVVSLVRLADNPELRLTDWYLWALYLGWATVILGICGIICVFVVARRFEKSDAKKVQ